LLFVGHGLLGCSEKEVGRMTLAKLLKLYKHYKNDYDFKMSNRTYRELQEMIDHEGEFLPD
jgi:uncharacterized protein YjiS (DUF1127 family)